MKSFAVGPRSTKKKGIVKAMIPTSRGALQDVAERVIPLRDYGLHDEPKRDGSADVLEQANGVRAPDQAVEDRDGHECSAAEQAQRPDAGRKPRGPGSGDSNSVTSSDNERGGEDEYTDAGRINQTLQLVSSLYLDAL
ncbi:hypothetical protein Leucomu_10665 [Leucobacter muris]|uniref:Uncharacterized protein n=1 Tax=Leucobacter muris TaxID=1935379 RepID=A0ABX5QGV2_9MICO|nr:hypothetical protein [Leucobacter muris]QAB18317.1 hypothetical protein Leucomu_10665 [Leucobacter muris]